MSTHFINFIRLQASFQIERFELMQLTGYQVADADCGDVAPGEIQDFASRHGSQKLQCFVRYVCAA